MPSQNLHPVTSPVVRNIRSLANRQNHQQHSRSGNSQLRPAKRRVSVQAGEMDSSHRASSMTSPIQGQNSTPSSSPHNCRVADITQHLTSIPSTRQRQTMITPTATLGRSSRHTPAPSRTTQTDSTRRVVSSPASGISSTHTPLTRLDILPTLIPNPRTHPIITNPLRTRATEMNQRERQWQFQPRAVCTPRSVVSGRHRICDFGHCNMTCFVFAASRVLELYMCNRKPFMSGSNLEMVSCAMGRVANALPRAPHRLKIEMYWNTAMQQNNIWSIAFEAPTKAILQEVC